VEFLRVASGAAATSLAVLTGDEDSLSSRGRALARLATTLTARPWAVTSEIVKDTVRQGLDADQVEAAIGVVAMFNYFTRVADASGIEFDYESPLPAFEPDRGRTAAPRPDDPVPDGPVPDGRAAAGQRVPSAGQLRTAWETWRTYLLDTGEPISRDERRLLARVAAEESADWTGAAELGSGDATGADGPLATFARKLSREPWCMQAGDLESLRAAGYTEPALLHVISVVAHQNATSRLALGLAAS
jgi:alkylhydroperoxidase family enzyme